MKEQVFWENIEVGNELPELIKKPTTRQLVQWAGASGDFYEIHYDKEYALNNSLPGQIVHGALKTAWLGQMLTDFAGYHGKVKKYMVSYRGMDVPGDIITCKGKIIAKYIDSQDHMVDIEIWLVNGKGEKTTLGKGTVMLPVKAE